MDGETITIPARFNGPPGSGNGGYTAGLVAGLFDGGAVEVSLRAPPPLDQPLRVVRTGDGVEVGDGETVVAQAQPTVVDLDPPAAVSVDEAVAASGRGPFRDPADHPFPRCFVCGPARAEGDGLRIFAGPVSGGGELFAAAWTPDASLAAKDGRLPDEVVWASLDCPTSGPVANDPGKTGFLPIVLGRLAARVDRPVMAERPHVVVAWPIAVDGRKREAAAALYTADGELCAISRALWIELRRGP